MKKIGILAGLLLAGAVLWAEPAVCEGEEVRLYTAVELFENYGELMNSLGTPEMMEGGIKTKILTVSDDCKNEGVNGNWCKIRLRLGLWNEKSDWIPKGTDCWCFIPEDAKIFRK